MVAIDGASLSAVAKSIRDHADGRVRAIDLEALLERS